MCRYGIRGVNTRYLNNNDIVRINKKSDEEKLFVDGIHFGIYDTVAEALFVIEGKNAFRARCLAQ